MAPIKTIRTSQSTRSSLLHPHIYEDPDALLNPDTDRVQADDKPVPQPRKNKVQFSDITDSPKQVDASYINQAVNPIKTELPPKFKPSRPAPKPPEVGKKPTTDIDQSRPTPASPPEPQPLNSDIKPPIPAKQKNVPPSYDTPVKSQTSEPQPVSYNKKPLVPPKQRSPSSAQRYETPSSARTQTSEFQLQPLSSEQKPPIPQKRQHYRSPSYSERPALVITQTPESYSELPQQNNICVNSTKKPEERPISPALPGNSQDASGVDRTKPQPPVPQKRRNPSSSSLSSSYQTPTNYSALPQQRLVSPALSGRSQDPIGAGQTNPQSQISGRIIPVPRFRQLSSSSSDLNYDRPSTAQNQTSQPQISGRLTPVPGIRQPSPSSSDLNYDTPSTAQTHVYETPLYILPPSPQPGSKYYKCRPPYIEVIPDDPNDMTLRRLEPRPPLQRTSDNNNDSIYALNADDITDLLKWLKKVSSQSHNVVSPVYGLELDEEIRSFEQKANNLRKARRLYHLLMMKRKESLENGIKIFQAICVQLEKVKKTNKAMGIAGGTTGAVGGVAAVVGIALAPVTMGTSLIVTAVGAGVAASAGGFGAHALKTNKKIVNRSTVEELVNNYKSNVADLEHCLAFIFSAMKELQRYKISRLQTAHSDAVRMAELSQLVFKNSLNTDGGISLLHLSGMTSESLLNAFSTEIDLYFTEKKGQKLNKSDKSKFSGTINNLTKNLQAELDHLIKMWETIC